jgi:hypothetical protein
MTAFGMIEVCVTSVWTAGLISQKTVFFARDMENDDGITHGDSILKFIVPSRTVGGESYLVDLNLHHPQCQCRFWVCNVAPQIRRGEKPKKYCHHWLAAYRQFSAWSLQVFSDQQKDQ